MSRCESRQPHHSLSYYALLFSLSLAKDPTCANGDIRLADGGSRREGRVEICYNNRWGTICHDSWDKNDAVVVCGQLGFDPEETGEYLNG